VIERIQALALILDRMNVLYERALALLERERGALVRLDYEELFRLIREKDEVLGAIRGLDRDRLRHQDVFAVVMNHDPDTITLRTIGEALIEQGDEASGVRLLELRDRMARTMDHLRDRIELNGRFIEASVMNLQGIATNLVNAYTGKAPKTSKKGGGVYNDKKRYEDDQKGRGALVERRL